MTKEEHNHRVLAEIAKNVYIRVLNKFLDICAEELSQETTDRILEEFNGSHRLSYLMLMENTDRAKEDMLYLDDRREPSESVKLFGNLYEKQWHVVRDVQAFKNHVIDKMPHLISFDHDLLLVHYGGDYSDGKTGYDALVWLLDYCDAYKVTCPVIKFHTMSEKGRERMVTYYNTWEKSRHIE